MTKYFHKLDAIAKESFKDHFIEGVPQTGKNEREALGISIAQYCEWDVFKICGVFFGALEDANFHTEAGIVSDWLEGWKKE